MMTEHQINERWHEVEHLWADLLAHIEELVKHPPKDAPPGTLLPGKGMVRWMKALSREARVAFISGIINQNPEHFFKAPNGQWMRPRALTKTKH